MTAIANPNPITPNACGAYWVSSATLSNPLFSATLRPYDGQYVVGNRSKSKRIVADTSKDTVAAAAVTGVFAQVERLAGKTGATCATISEADPLTPIIVQCVFSDKTVYRIPDLFALIASDTQVATAYAAVLSYLVTQ